MSRVVLALVAVSSIAVASPPPPPHPSTRPVIASSDRPPRFELQTALGMAFAYASQHAIRLDKAGFLQAGVFDLTTRNWVFDWISPAGKITVITVHEDGTIVSS